MPPLSGHTLLVLGRTLARFYEGVQRPLPPRILELVTKLEDQGGKRG